MHHIDNLSVHSINTAVVSLAIFSDAYKLTEFVLFVCFGFIVHRISNAIKTVSFGHKKETIKERKEEKLERRDPSAQQYKVDKESDEEI